MIPKAEILEAARETGLLATTVEKDYVLGWVLAVIAEHPEVSDWCFKGGTCLKKCYFDTYRFSEDLDFTIPEGVAYDLDASRESLADVAAQVQDRTGIEFPLDGLEVRESVNKRDQRTFGARMTFSGPLNLPRAERQRIRFDLTRDELVVEPPQQREVFHGYSDAPSPPARVRCYSLNEVLAEKLRALVERSGSGQGRVRRGGTSGGTSVLNSCRRTSWESPRRSFASRTWMSRHRSGSSGRSTRACSRSTGATRCATSCPSSPRSTNFWPR